jgi:small subunit ribosomal protein S17
VTEERNNGAPEATEPQEVAPEATEPEAATATELETAESTQGPDRAETPQDLIEGETVDAGLAPSASKGPALDQDEGQVQSDTERNRRKERVGLVVSDKAEKTVTVRVETLVRHPRYKKRIRRSKKFMVHDEGNEARSGDTVRIIETRPLSARKRWRLANIISRAE